MTQDEADCTTLPRLYFLFLPTARYHFSAMRKFFEAKGFSPYSSDITRLLGLSLAGMESSIVVSEYSEFYTRCTHRLCFRTQLIVIKPSHGPKAPSSLWYPEENF